MGRERGGIQQRRGRPQDEGHLLVRARRDVRDFHRGGRLLLPVPRRRGRRGRAVRLARRTSGVPRDAPASPAAARGAVSRAAAAMWLAALLVAAALLSTCSEKPEAPTRANPFDPDNPESGGDPFHLAARAQGGAVVLA